MENKLKIEYIDISELKEYENNAKLHPKEQIEQIKKSIQEFGFNDPIAVWHDNEIIEGHGRLVACKELGIASVPVIRMDGLSDEERRAYMLVHNKLTMNSDFDFEALQIELDKILDIDMSEFGFTLDDGETENPYTMKTNIPQYEITGEQPLLEELANTEKTDELIAEIMGSDVSDEEKDFLIKAAHRHTAFNYAKVAEYYAHSGKEMQRLMERSALVIIDINDAIANGYARLVDKLREIVDEA